MRYVNNPRTHESRVPGGLGRAGNNNVIKLSLNLTYVSLRSEACCLVRSGVIQLLVLRPALVRGRVVQYFTLMELNSSVRQ